MAVFATKFRGVKRGEIYPTKFKPGETCPPELVAAATALGVLEGQPATKAANKAAKAA